ncbi:UNVERIFIED_CONTAM: hypothetical protein RMT77_006989 [Armadillidium vulgare]
MASSQSTSRTINLLVVGSSEVRMFAEGRDYLKNQYNVKVQVEYKSGAILDDCLSQIKRKMTPHTHMIILWALTPYGWRRTPIRTKGKQDITVFRPALHVSIDQIPGIMNQIMRYVSSVNPDCDVYVSIPAIKDLYQFNQQRIVRSWGFSYKNFLKNHYKLGQEPMRDHSIYVYRLFTSLKQDKFYWPEKKLLYGNGALNCFIEKRASRKSLKKVSVPHTEYLQRRSLNLNSNLLPDGLHGTQEFLRYYLINHQKMFREFWGNSTNIPPQSIKVTITAPTPAPRKSLLGDFPGDLYRQCQSPSLISVNQPVPRSSPPPDRISELLYQFGTLDQPSTSRAGLVVESPHQNACNEDFYSPFCHTPHTSTHYPVPLVVRNNAFTNQPSSFPHLVDNSVYDQNTSQNEPVNTNVAMEAHAVVRKFLDNKISKGQGEKRKLMMSLDCLIEAAKYENEMIKRFKE